MKRDEIVLKKAIDEN